jgi:hypothetical protein
MRRPLRSRNLLFQAGLRAAANDVQTKEEER